MHVIYPSLCSYIFCCSDVDQCLTNNGGCAHTCTNELPGFTCSCRTGFTLDTDNKGCVGESRLSGKYLIKFYSDIDECASSPCGDVCVNTNGSFRCVCTSNTTLDTDGRSCICKNHVINNWILIRTLTCKCLVDRKYVYWSWLIVAISYILYTV